MRFADLDPNGHVNNAVYATYFETGRVTLVKDPRYGLMAEGLGWIMVRLDIHFRAELRWPGTIEMGLGVAKFGRTSVTCDQVVFSQGICVASAQSVTVLIDEATRKSTLLTSAIIENFSRGFAAAYGFQGRAVKPAAPASTPRGRRVVGDLDLAGQTRIGLTSKPKSSMSSSIGEGGPTFSRQASST